MKNSPLAKVWSSHTAIKTVVLSRCWAVCRLGGGLALSFGLLACASAPPKEAAPALLAAQRLEQRAAQAFSQGNWTGAQSDFQTAADVYASLALTEPQMRALLSLARVQADAGQSAQALQTLGRVLAQMAVQGSVSASTQLLAHGRAAALLMATNANAAQDHLRQAQALCAGQCTQDAALWVVQARLMLQQGGAGDAQAAAAATGAATAALQAAKTPVDRANALRVRAQAALVLQQPSAAVIDAQAALVLDQSLGLSARVLDDLRCLVDAYTALGDSAQVKAHQALLQEAQAARLALQTTPQRESSQPRVAP